jgi:hypothetical protein
LPVVGFDERKLEAGDYGWLQFRRG